MKTVAIIPARMGSSRYPGKPLAKICGCTMIEHVYRRTRMCKALSEVVVATCDQEIITAVEGFGGRAIMTSSTHQRASDRIAEAMMHLQGDIALMIQGDEPLLDPRMLDLVIAPVANDPKVQCVNLMLPIRSEEEFKNPNAVKVVVDLQSDALYFSREPIPTSRYDGFTKIRAFKQTGIILFRRSTLELYAKLSPTPAEIAESVDMMRFVEHGHKIRMVEGDFNIQAVDTPADLQMVEGIMRNDPIAKEYL